jgi:SAM-dependent methyltransferase
MYGDACNLPSDLGQFGCILAANLICRLPNPYKFLDRLPSLVAPGGIVVFTCPFSWLEEFTPKVCNIYCIHLTCTFNTYM